MSAVLPNGARAAATSAGGWYRSAGFFAIIFATTAASPSDTSGRNCFSGVITRHETGAEHAHKALNDRADQLAVAAAKRAFEDRARALRSF